MTPLVADSVSAAGRRLVTFHGAFDHPKVATAEGLSSSVDWDTVFRAGTADLRPLWEAYDRSTPRRVEAGGWHLGAAASPAHQATPDEQVLDPGKLPLVGYKWYGAQLSWRWSSEHGVLTGWRRRILMKEVA